LASGAVLLNGEAVGRGVRDAVGKRIWARGVGEAWRSRAQDGRRAPCVRIAERHCIVCVCVCVCVWRERETERWQRLVVVVDVLDFEVSPGIVRSSRDGGFSPTNRCLGRVTVDNLL